MAREVKKICDACGLGFESAIDLATHRTMDCPAAAARLAALREVAGRIANERMRGEVGHCPWCTFTATAIGDLASHLAAAHRRDLESEIEKQRDSRGRLTR